MLRMGLTHVDAMRIASKTIGGLYDGATTRELDYDLHPDGGIADRGRAGVLASSRRVCCLEPLRKKSRNRTSTPSRSRWRTGTQQGL